MNNVITSITSENMKKYNHSLLLLDPFSLVLALHASAESGRHNEEQNGNDEDRHYLL
jgi:hypothetical protein